MLYIYLNNCQDILIYILIIIIIYWSVQIWHITSTNGMPTVFRALVLALPTLRTDRELARFILD